MGLTGYIQGRIARKARKKLGSWAPLVAGFLMLLGFVLQVLGETAASDVAMQLYRALGVDSPVTADTLVGLRDALNALMPQLYAWLGPIAGAGAAYKLQVKRADAAGTLSKPPVIGDSVAADLEAVPGGAEHLRMLQLWRHHMNDDGMPADKAFQRARREVFGLGASG